MENSSHESGDANAHEMDQEIEKVYQEQREEWRGRNEMNAHKDIRLAPKPAWEPSENIPDESEKVDKETEEEAFSPRPKDRKRTGKQRMQDVMALVFAVSGTAAGVLGLAEWNKQKELKAIQESEGNAYYADEHGNRIDVDPSQHQQHVVALINGVQSLVHDRAALSLAVEPAEKRLLEKKISSNTEWVRNTLRDAHPFTKKIVGAPDGNIETLLAKYEDDLKQMQAPDGSQEQAPE